MYFNAVKNRSEEMQTLRSGCSKAEPNASPQTHSRGRGTAKI